MNFEDSIADLAKAIREQTAVLSGGIAKATAAAGAKATTAAPKAETPKADKAPKAPSEADIKKVFGDYIGSVPKTDGAGRKVITDNVKAILAHFGVEQASALPAESRAEAIGYVKQFIAGETPSFMSEDGEDGDGGDSLV